MTVKKKNALTEIFLFQVLVGTNIRPRQPIIRPNCGATWHGHLCLCFGVLTVIRGPSWTGESGKPVALGKG
jgi:hypothetical protein